MWADLHHITLWVDLMRGGTPQKFWADDAGGNPPKILDSAGPNMVINDVPRAPQGLILIENTKQGMGNPILRTPRPGDPYLYELCPSEILPKIWKFIGVPPPMVRRPDIRGSSVRFRTASTAPCGPACPQMIIYGLPPLPPTSSIGSPWKRPVENQGREASEEARVSNVPKRASAGLIKNLENRGWLA